MHITQGCSVQCEVLRFEDLGGHDEEKPAAAAKNGNGIASERGSREKSQSASSVVLSRCLTFSVRRCTITEMLNR